VLYNAAQRGSISRMIIGNSDPHCTTFAYASPGELLAFIDAQFADA
jgi:hypothetical protein